MRKPGRLAIAGQTRTTRSIVQGWVTAIGTAVVALAVMHVFDDRAGAWWSIRAIASISVAAALLALWFRLPAYVFISGLLLNVAGMVGWVAWGSATLESLVQVNVVCLAAGSAAWTLLDGLHPAGVPHGQLRHGPLPFAHLAALAAVGLLAALVAAGVVAELFRLADLRLEIGRIDWLALVAAAVAVALCLWDRKASSCWPGCTSWDCRPRAWRCARPASTRWSAVGGRPSACRRSPCRPPCSAGCCRASGRSAGCCGYRMRRTGGRWNG